MTRDGDGLVFDTGPARHMAERGWFGLVRYLADGRDVIIPESVEVELQRQSLDRPVLRQILDADWVTVDRSTDDAFLEAFAGFEERLVRDDLNRGECGVLALGKVRGHEVVLDDRTARTIAEESSLRLTGTLGLLCQAIRAGRLTVGMVEQLADDLLENEYRLPFRRGGFRRWADEQGLVDGS